jgi:hypothetical protein
LRGAEEEVCDIHYESLCRAKKEIFESIPDDKPVKTYFDADYVFYDGDFQDYNVKTANEVLRLNKLYLSKALLAKTGTEPKFAVAESHSRRRMKNDKEVWGYSFHITIPNIICLKNDLKKFTNELNNAILEDQKNDSNEIATDRYTDIFMVWKILNLLIQVSIIQENKNSGRFIHQNLAKIDHSISLRVFLMIWLLLTMSFIMSPYLLIK